MKVLITGIGGFVGRYLADYCISKGDEVYGLERTKSNIERAKTYECDITDAPLLAEIVKEVRPEQIYHLAAISFVPAANKNPKLTYDINFYGTFNLYEAVKNSGLNPKILFIGSSDVYGKVDKKDLPLKESAPLNPASVYAVSKAAADILSGYYSSAGLLNILIVRPFNHTGPGQSPEFVCPSFARQIVEIEKGQKQAILEVGNLDARRDFTDVRDVVRAYWMLMNSYVSSGGIFNVCSGKAVSMKDMLDILLSMSKVEIKVNQDPARMRAADIPALYGDNARLMAATGWKPSIPINKTIEDILEYWRSRS